MEVNNENKLQETISKMYIYNVKTNINTFYYIFLDPKWVKHI